MDLSEFAQAILFGTRLEDKLTPLLPGWTDAANADAPLQDAPTFPGRPEKLAHVGKAEFPSLSQIAQDSTRGRILHFFANHELLAMELMALMLLKFPNAPEPFRAGIARTIAEEQSHMRLYLDRMRELGVDFGDLPVSDYFWKSMKDMRSPLEFVTQMSLTLEQANLDFSLYYKDVIEKAGDEKTAAILDRVYREEIGHVKHGVAWFNRWRTEDAPPGESDWEAYLRLLPSPMTARRAKGIGFTADARREAGLSETFIRELEVYSGSRGQPPTFWIYNPLCDAEIARGKPGLQPTDTIRRLSQDLEQVMGFLASDKDVVLVERIPDSAFLKKLQDAGFSTPVYRLKGRPGDFPREDKIGGLEPWGWSPETFERFKPWRDRLSIMDAGNAEWCLPLLAHESFASSGIGPLFSKSWSVTYLRQWVQKNPELQNLIGTLDDVGQVFTRWEDAREHVMHALAASRSLLAKAPYGTSGTQNKRVLKVQELDGPIGGWIRNTIESQGSIVLEPWLDKKADLSIQLEVTKGAPRLLGIRRFMIGSRLEYRGTYLDPKLSSFSSQELQFLHSGALDAWKSLAQDLGRELGRLGYQGPAGIDALLWRTSRGELRLKPLVELNPRWTMGRVALELEKHVVPGVPAAWVFVPLKELTENGTTDQDKAVSWVEALTSDHPIRLQQAGAGVRIAQGVLPTLDPNRAQEVLTLLVVGDSAVETFQKREWMSSDARAK